MTRLLGSGVAARHSQVSRKTLLHLLVWASARVPETDALSSAEVADAGRTVSAEGRAATEAKNEVQTSIRRHGVVALDVGAGFALEASGSARIAVKGWCASCARAAGSRLQGSEKTNTASRARRGLQTRSLRFFDFIVRHGMSRSYWTENQQLRVALRVHCAGALACLSFSRFSLSRSLLSLFPLSLCRLLCLALSLSKFRYQFCQNYLHVLSSP